MSQRNTVGDDASDAPGASGAGEGMAASAAESSVPSPGRRGSAAAEDGLASRILRSERGRLVLVVLAALGLSAIYITLFREHDADRVGPSLPHYSLFTTAVVLLFTLSFYLLRYLIRLVSEWKAGTLGSRFKLKLVVTFIGLCLAPALVLYFAAIYIIFEAVDRALDPQVDAIVADAQSVAQQVYDASEADLAGDVHDVAAGLARAVGEVNLQHRGPTLQYLMREVAARQFSVAELHFRDSPHVLEVTGVGQGGPSPLAAGEVPAQRVEDELNAAFAGESFERREWVDGTLHVIAGTPVTVPGVREPAAVLVVARHVPADLARRVTRLRSAAQEHSRVRGDRQWLKTEQAVLFAVFSLVIILAAFWVSIYIARSITVPIQRLAEATVEVRRGNLAHVVTWRGNDELAVLSEAFNDMARDLRIKAEEVDRAAAELRDANVALGRANVELGQRRDDMEMLLQAMSAGVLALDATGRVVVANRAALQILQLPDGATPGCHFEDLLAGEALAELRREIARALAGERLREARELVLTLGRGPVHLQVVITSQAGSAVASGGLLLVFEDVTELVRAQKIATWQAVARRIAHEIKNPLTPIQLSAQRILKKFRAGAPDLPQVLEAGVETIIAEVGGLKQMVDEFSRFARMPSVRAVPGDLNAMLQSVAALYLGHERLEVSASLAPDLPPVAFDPELLRRAVVNLVDNAVEATEGRGHIEIRSAVPPGRRIVRVEVADDGPGVPSADREKLFLPYFTTRKRGTGLGLAIVHRIVADHHGRVRVQDNEPTGARFVIDLPLSGRSRRRDADDLAASRQLDAGAPANPRPQRAKVRGSA